jgi:hypothetical protein
VYGGVALGSGDSVTISATGEIYYDYGANLKTGPEGLSPNPYTNLSPLQSAGHGGLIGKVGSYVFPIPGFYSGKPGVGSLYLRVNDTSVSNNSGSFYVVVDATIDPCPSYRPVSFGEPIVYKAGQPLTGPGGEVKAILAKFGIVASATCSCNARAAQMDAWGMAGCLKRIPEITGWLREEAEKRGLWFFAPAGVALILLAVSLAALKRLWKGINK